MPVLGQMSPSDGRAHSLDVCLQKLAGRPTLVIVGQMLGIIVTVFAVDDSQIRLRAALQIGLGGCPHRDRVAHDRLEPWKVAQRAFSDGVMRVDDAVMHSCRGRGQEGGGQAGYHAFRLRDETGAEVVARLRQDLMDEGLHDGLDLGVGPHPGVPNLVVLRCAPHVHSAEALIRTVEEETRDLRDIAIP